MGEGERGGGEEEEIEGQWMGMEGCYLIWPPLLVKEKISANAVTFLDVN